MSLLSHFGLYMCLVLFLLMSLLLVILLFIYFYIFFFFKQKTAYEMRISDWSSDVCSSDLAEHARASAPAQVGLRRVALGHRHLLGGARVGHGQHHVGG